MDNITEWEQMTFPMYNPDDMQSQLQAMQFQINEMYTSMHKVRRGIFARVGELRREAVEARKEVEELKSLLAQEQKQDRWRYKTEEKLFELAYA
jgi:hypothetical protein